MEIVLNLIFTLILITAQTAFFYILFKKQEKHETLFLESIKLLASEISRIHKRIDGIFVIDSPEPNEAIKVDKNFVDISEENHLKFPQDVKFTVEGGDVISPPGYKTE